MRQIASALLLTVLLPGCSSVRPEPPRPAAPAPAASHFVFVNDPWINLHHFLYHWARAEAPAEPGRRGPRPVEVAERSQATDLTPEESRAWNAAVSWYQKELSQKDLLFDEGMIDLRSRIGRISDHPEELASLPQAAALEPAMAVYRRHWWNAHEAANRAWIDQLRPKLETFEPLLARRLEEAYGGHFPAEKVRVDACVYANWAGAYTTAVPPQIVVSSTDPDQQDAHALEVLFHEVSHTDGLEGPLHAALEEGFAKNGGAPPQDLWHYFIFYTAGALTNEALRSQGLPEIVPYPERTGMYRRLPAWNRYREALDHSWKEFLAGKMARETAIDRIAQELLAPEGAGPAVRQEPARRSFAGMFLADTPPDEPAAFRSSLEHKTSAAGRHEVTYEIDNTHPVSCDALPWHPHLGSFRRDVDRGGGPRRPLGTRLGGPRFLL